METRRTARVLPLFVVAVSVACSAGVVLTYAKDKRSVSPDDPTYQLFRLLDNSYAGKLTDFCLLADTYPDPMRPGQTLQHVLQVEYDRDRFFGRLRIYVRGVSQLTPAQLKEYTPEQIYGFGSGVEKFEKINPGPFGQEGDVYVRAVGDSRRAAVPITDDARKEYEFLLTQYILPALEKK